MGLNFDSNLAHMCAKSRYSYQCKSRSIRLQDYYIMIKTHPEIKGFILLQEYPGCNEKIGDFVHYDPNFSKYPNIWKPVLYKEVERDRKLNELLGDERKTTEISE